MAGPTQQTSQDRVKITQGLMLLVPNAPDPASVESMDDDAVDILLKHNRAEIDRNRKPAKPRAGLTNFRDMPPVQDQPGAKDKAIDLVRRAQSEKPEDALNDRERLSVQSLLGASGFRVNFDNKIDSEERSQLPQLEQRMREGLSIGSIFNQNYRIEQGMLERQQRAETSATLANQEQATINGKFTAGLVYAGYLKPNEMGDGKAAAIAMNQFIFDHTPHDKLVSEQKKIYRDMTAWQPSPYALEFLNKHTANLAPHDPADSRRDRLESDLESGDPSRIALAQNFLGLRGANIAATGKVDEVTAEAARSAITKPLTMPPGLVENGEVDRAMMENMAARGQLYLPITALTPAEQKAAQAYPLAKDRGPELTITREQFIATRLIGDDPTRYERVLAEENERRSKATLDAPIVSNQQANQEFHGLRERLPADVKPGMPPQVAELVTLNRAINQADEAVTRAGSTLPSATTDENGRPRIVDVGQIKVAAERQRDAAETAFSRRYDAMYQDGSLRVVQDYIKENERRPEAPKAVDAPVAASDQPGWLGRLFGIGAEAKTPDAPAGGPSPARPAAAPPEQNPWVYTPGA